MLLVAVPQNNNCTLRTQCYTIVQQKIMEITITHKEGFHLVGSNEEGIETHFDAHSNLPAGASPMNVMLQTLPACSAMDVLDILAKKRKTVAGLTIKATATRAEDFPKVFTSVHLHYTVQSPDATMHDVERCIELSQEKYCSVSAMFKAAGCVVTTSAELLSV